MNDMEIMEVQEETALPSIETWVFAQGDDLKTDSRIVAKVFGRQHKELLRSIRNLECSEDFTKRNFALCHEISDLQNGKPLPYYEMTYDGFMILVMGFTGKEAMAIKERYIAAFNEMRMMITDYHYGLIAQLHRALEAEAVSRLAGSLAGRALSRRKNEKRYNQSKIEKLRRIVQPDFFNALLDD